jgi:hypothetical protein
MIIVGSIIRHISSHDIGVYEGYKNTGVSLHHVIRVCNFERGGHTNFTYCELSTLLHFWEEL